MRYRRSDAKGACHFFTVNLAQRHQNTLTDNIDLFRSVIAHVREKHPFVIEAMVVLPEHLHSIWSLSEGDNEYPKRWGVDKGRFLSCLASYRVPLKESGQ